MYSDDPPKFTIDTRLFYQYVNDLDDIKKEIIEYLGTLDYRTAENIVDDLLKENGIENIDWSSVSYQKLCRGILKAQLKGIDIEKKQMRGEYSDDKAMPTPEMLTSINSGKVSKMLSEVSDEYWKENESGWKERTIVEYQMFNKRLLESFGYETEVDTIDFQTVKDYRDKLKETGNRGKPLSIKRVNMYIEYATALFNFAKRNKYIRENPASGLMYKDKRSPDQITDVFDNEDLQKLFRSKEYVEDKHLNSHNFWVSLLGLYTGCRLEEICQLYVDDVKEVKGIWVLDINEQRSDQSVKTSERRLVPLHPFLVDDLKFIDFIKTIDDQAGRIFPKLKRINNRYGHKVGDWFNRYKKRCRIIAQPRKKSSHSFRHTVTNHLVQKDIPEHQIAMLIGHANPNITTGRYGKKFEPKMLLDKVVKKLDYGIDLSHLKNSKYVIKD